MSLNHRWHAFRRVPSFYLPNEWRSWVLDRGSLTQRLIHASNGDFSVRVTRQQWLQPKRDEALLLGCPITTHALIREVELLCHGEVWVVARSVIPFTTLQGEERQLKVLGNRSLGSFLFKSRAMKRGPLQITQTSPESLAMQTDNRTDEPLWGRRSLFFLHGKPLLVSELFLPTILNHETKA
ncbi:chorismate--pyruvate lyase family protein [Alkalimarinus sediminis]|uniref:Probable chorismate pyruvate-lyase n=1 Tax=Alkalimarinus sediminis TaxID=1632866 RepID=A0A9E8HG19_9ALTE|nr:chorismate lyase [Alkalimarinus sediminis]UZW73978.1 chorismate lyase [Alkalimarinus sediminis]